MSTTSTTTTTNSRLLSSESSISSPSYLKTKGDLFYSSPSETVGISSSSQGLLPPLPPSVPVSFPNSPEIVPKKSDKDDSDDSDDSDGKISAGTFDGPPRFPKKYIDVAFDSDTGSDFLKSRKQLKQELKQVKQQNEILKQEKALLENENNTLKLTLQQVRTSIKTMENITLDLKKSVCLFD